MGIEELVQRAVRVALAGEEMLVILRGEECRLVVIEPPGDARRGRVLEVDDRVLVARELALVEERAGAVHQPVVVVGGAVRDATRGESA